MVIGHSIWEQWIELKDECKRRKIKKDIIDKFERLLVKERQRYFYEKMIFEGLNNGKNKI